MSAATSIEWTDKTWNPVTGCTKVSQGCKHCYAETIAGRRLPHGGFLDRPFTEVRTHEDRLLEPLRWRKPEKVFVNSMSDLFHEAVPGAFIDRVFAVMALARQHTFQILTKRPERMRAYCAARPNGGESQFVSFPRYGSTAVLWQRSDLQPWPLPNVWLGVSVEDQATADQRIPLLLDTPAAIRFLSCEPLLGGLDIAKHRPGANGLWLIVGGESGPGARRCWVPWVRSVVRQGQQAGCPVFVKQLGSNVCDRNDAGFTGDEDRDWPEIHVAEDRIEHDLDGTRDGYQGAPVRIHLRDRKGGDPAEWPEDLRVREFPGESA